MHHWELKSFLRVRFQHNVSENVLKWGLGLRIGHPTPVPIAVGLFFLFRVRVPRRTDRDHLKWLDFSSFVLFFFLLS